MLTAEVVIKKLGLEPLLPEGGYFKQTQKSTHTYQTPNGERALCTSIYYLVTPTRFSKLHKLTSTEIYHFYLGDPLHLTLIHPNGKKEDVVLGNDLLAGQFPQLVIAPEVWQGSFIQPGTHGFSLVGTNVSPGFDYADFVLGDRASLLAKFPDHAASIEKLT